MNLKTIILIFILIALIVVIWLKRDLILNKPMVPINSINTTKIKDIPLINIPNRYIQNDKRWGNDSLGNTSESMRNVGCLVSSVASNLSYYDIDINPKLLNKQLTKLEGYTSKGWLIWGRLNDLSEKNIVIEFPALTHDMIDSLLLDKKPVLAKILIKKHIPHWLLVVGKKNGDYLMYDPLNVNDPEKISKYNSPIYSIRLLKVEL